MIFLALVATAADSEKGGEEIGGALQNTAIKNDASPKECTVSKAIKPEYEHNRFAYGRLSALFQAGNRFSKMAPGILNAVLSFFSPSEALIRLYLSCICLSISAFFIADAYFHSRYHAPDSPKHPCRWSESEFPLPRIPHGQRGKPAPGCPSAATGSRCSWGWMGL